MAENISSSEGMIEIRTSSTPNLKNDIVLACVDHTPPDGTQDQNENAIFTEKHPQIVCSYQNEVIIQPPAISDDYGLAVDLSHLNSAQDLVSQLVGL